MKHVPVTPRKRKSVNLSLDTGVVDAARKVGINLSQVSEAAIHHATRQAEAAAWKDKHRDWIQANNAWVDRNGLPLGKYRLF